MKKIFIFVSFYSSIIFYIILYRQNVRNVILRSILTSYLFLLGRTHRDYLISRHFHHTLCSSSGGIDSHGSLQRNSHRFSYCQRVSKPRNGMDSGNYNQNTISVSLQIWRAILIDLDTIQIQIYRNSYRYRYLYIETYQYFYTYL